MDVKKRNKILTWAGPEDHGPFLSVSPSCVYHATVADRMKLRPAPEMPEL